MGAGWMLLSAAAVMSPVVEAGVLQAGHWGGEHVLGTSFDVRLQGGGEVLAGVAAQTALMEITRLDRILSTWRADSEIARLHQTRAAVASPDLYQVLALCEAWRVRTHGAFDVVRDGPPGARGLCLDPRTRRASLADGASLDIDALAKGYVIDRAFIAARRAAPQARALLLDLGGDMRFESAPEVEPWTIAIADPARRFDNAPPLQTVTMRSGALAASGLGARSAAAPVRDPRSGARVKSTALAAAIAPNAAAADALATSIAVRGAQGAHALFKGAPDLGGLLVDADGARSRFGVWPMVQAGACQAAWPDGRALAISYDIPAHSAPNYERPYVAIWITDEARNVVRTLQVLGPQARWRESNYIYWRRAERFDAARVASLARPTRAPGRYDLIWDGRTDDGALAPRGRYVLNIEASREHGGHSYVSVPLDLSADALDLTAEASQELGATQIRFGRAR